MIVIIDVNENINREGIMYVRNVDAAIEELFHNELDGIVFTESVCSSETARLKAIVKAIDNDVVVLQKEQSVDDSIKEIQKIRQLARLSQMTFSDTLAPENLADQITVL
ncbi:MAG TPA: hypothetical protein VGB84_06480 [Arachidicoccus sp.]